MRERGDQARSDWWVRVPPFSAQAIATLVILLVCGGLVLYPVVFLIEAALNTGDPQEFTLQEWGLGNFTALAEEWHVLGNTALVACLATVMAVIFGFVVAWILTRTKVPGGGWLERLMELPYYMTPLVGALAWAILASPRTGALNQLWHAVGGGGDLFDIYSPFGIAWVMALFEGTVAFVMISAAMKSMDPSLEETSRVLGAGKIRTVLKVTLPLVMPGVLGDDLCLRGDAGFLRRRLCVGDSRAVIRDHDRDLAGDNVLSA